MRDQTGAKNAKAKLTEDIVRDMRKMRYEGKILADIASKYLVNEETVRAVVTLKSWAGVITKYDTFLLRNKGLINRHLPPGFEVTAASVRRLFKYDPDEGILRWNVRGQGIQFGEPAGSSSTPNGHLNVAIGGKDIFVARVIWLYMTGNWPPRLVDHIDRNKQNNKWKNLRLATKSQNSMNSKVRSDNTTGHKGIFLNKNGTYHAYINVDGRRFSLGFGLTLEQAIEARQKAEAQYHGEFAAKNLAKDRPRLK